MLRSHLTDVQGAGGFARDQPVPQDHVLGLVVHVQGIEVEVGVAADDRRAGGVARLDLAHQLGELPIQPADDPMDEDHPRRVAAGVLPRRQLPGGRQSLGHPDLHPIIDIGVAARWERYSDAPRATSPARDGVPNRRDCRLRCQ